jgi:hypothetical protein
MGVVPMSPIANLLASCVIACLGALLVTVLIGGML